MKLKFHYSKGDKVITPLGHGEIVSDIDNEGFCFVKHYDFTDEGKDTFKLTTFQLMRDIGDDI